jgi:NAD(P)-dependent dehydrogenase (short-subunit alcohol dehydrogenase family)
MNLKGKIVLVTGSTDGVGRLVARRLADQGPVEIFSISALRSIEMIRT